jgi:hypothetical protein
MGLFDDMKRFLETQLDDFMSKNPHLQIQVMEEQLQQQESDTMSLLLDLRQQEKQIQAEVLMTAQGMSGLARPQRRVSKTWRRQLKSGWILYSARAISFGARCRGSKTAWLKALSY